MQYKIKEVLNDVTDLAASNRGVQSISIEYKDSTSIYLNPGVVHIWNGSTEYYCTLPSQLVFALSDRTASTQYAIYVNSSIDDLDVYDFHYSPTMPSKNLSKYGQYHPTNTSWRCVGFIHIDISGNVQKFNISRGVFRLSEESVDVPVHTLNISTTWVPHTIPVPLGGLTAILQLQVMGGGDEIIYRPSGSTKDPSGVYYSINSYPMGYMNVGRPEKEVLLLVGDDKKIEIKATGGTAETIIQTTGFVLPDMIYTGTSGAVPKVKETATVDSSFLGFQSGLDVIYVDATRFGVKSGQIHISQGTTNKILVLQNDITTDVSSLSANTQYAVYVSPPSSGNIITVNEIKYSSTMPVEDTAAGGWYHPTNVGWRCIGFLRSNSTQTINIFYNENNKIRLLEPINIFGQNYNVFTVPDKTYTVPSPMGSMNCEIRATGVISSGDYASVTVYPLDMPTTAGIPVTHQDMGLNKLDDNIFTIRCSYNRQIVFISRSTVEGQIDLVGVFLPKGIGSSGVSSVSQTTVIQQQQVQSAKIRGVQSVSVEYKDSTSVYLNQGIIHIQRGTKEVWSELKSQYTLTMSGLSANTQYAIYISSNTFGTITGSDIHYSSTMPNKSYSKNGYYHPTNTDWRCIGFVYSDSSGSIKRFKVEKNVWKNTASDMTPDFIDIQVSNVWTSKTLSSPLGNIYIIGRLIGSGNTPSDLFWRETNSNGNGIGLIYINGTTTRVDTEETLFLNDSKSVDFKWSSAGTNTLTWVTCGYVLPDLIYTGQSSGSILSENNNYSIPLADPSLLGFQSGLEVEYVDSTRFRVRNGQIHIAYGDTDAMVVNRNDITQTISSVTNNTWYSVYVKLPNSGSEISASDIVYSTTRPVEDRVAMGWYNPNNPGHRCIGFFKTDASGNMVGQRVSNKQYISFENLVVIPWAYSLPATQTDFTTTTQSPIKDGEIVLLWYTVSGSTSYFKTPSSIDAGQASVTANSTERIVIPVTNYIFQAKSYTPFSIEVRLLGFILPNGIGSTGASAVAKYSISVSDPTKIGFKSNTLKVESLDSTTFKVFAGRIHINDGVNDDIYSVQSSVSKIVSDLTASTWYAVYVKVPQTGVIIESSDIEYSSTMPVYDENKLGWYHPSNTGQRAVGFLKSNSNSTLLQFTLDGKYFEFDERIALFINAVIPSSQTTLAALDIPIKSIVKLLIYPFAQDTFVRTNGSTSSGKYVGNGGAYQRVEIMTDSNKLIQIKADGNVGYGMLMGFILPDGM